MAVSYRYVIGPVVEHTLDGLTYYGPPESCVSWIDLRRMSEQSALGQLGCGFFTMPADWSIPSGYHWLAQSQGPGDCRSLYLTAQDQSAWESLIGVRPTRTASTMVVDALDETLTDLADPTGESAPKPLVPRCPPPGPPAEAEIILGGHSVVRRKQMPSVGRWWNNVSALHRRDVQEIVDRDPSDRLWRKYVGSLAHKYFGRWDDERGNGLIPDAAKKGRAPSRGNGNPSARRWALMPETTHTETWPNNAADIEATAQDHTWVTDQGLGTLQVSGGECYCDAASAGSWHHGRCESAVSSEDHEATAPFTVSANYGCVLLTRMAAGSTVTMYAFDFIYNSSRRLYKWITGTPTILTTSAMSGGLSAVECTIQSSGSSHYGIMTGQSDISTTDTAITGNLKGGCGANYQSSVTDAKLGAWSIADLAAATSYPHGLLPLLGVG